MSTCMPIIKEVLMKVLTYNVGREGHHVSPDVKVKEDGHDRSVDVIAGLLLCAVKVLCA